MSAPARMRGAAALALGAALFVTTGAASSAEQAAPSATVSPSSGLASGDDVAVALTGFAADAPVYAVQCDARVLTTGDSAWCDSEHVTVLVPHASGAASGDVTVRAVEDFVSANGEGVCDATTGCVLAFQQPTEAGANAAVATISFGTRTWTVVDAPARVTSRRVPVDVTVVGRSRDLPEGVVEVLEGGDVVGEAALDADGSARLVLPLGRGAHRLEVRYLGDRVFLPSARDVRVKVVR